MAQATTHEPTRIKIVSRWDASIVLFECDVPDGIESGMAMRHALEKAVESRANLSGANLSGANLSDANLSRAYLSYAYLPYANLSRANLSRANLSDANLSRAYLSYANLSGANLSDANLSRAYLSYAYLPYANLSRANLSRANLSYAYLSRANLSCAKWTDAIAIQKAPVQISGLHWFVTILDNHMQIGCELHTLAEWAAFDDARIVDMDGREALRFWRAHKAALLGLARSAGRGCEVAEVSEVV